MKKIISLLMTALIIMSALCIFASAADTATYVYEVDGIEYTVEFEDNNLSAEKQAAVAAKLTGADDNSGVMPANVLCDVFGHDLATSSVNVISHKVRGTAPRCKKEIYDVTACEDCDYSVQTLVGTSFIYCCE